MRKPRDIGAELKALTDKAKNLKAKRLVQLGELVTVTGADVLDLETLTGALLHIALTADQANAKETWRADGANFFQQRRRRKNSILVSNTDGDDDHRSQPNEGGHKSGRAPS